MSTEINENKVLRVFLAIVGSKIHETIDLLDLYPEGFFTSPISVYEDGKKIKWFSLTIGPTNEINSDKEIVIDVADVDSYIDDINKNDQNEDDNIDDIDDIKGWYYDEIKNIARRFIKQLVNKNKSV